MNKPDPQQYPNARTHSMKRVPLTRGKFALVDDTDARLVRDYSWHLISCNKKGKVRYYATAYIPGGRGKRALMHRLIAGFPPFSLDHKNCDGLDNRRQNLRPADRYQNNFNRRRRATNSSGAKGVSPSRSGKWCARIQAYGRSHWLGIFSTKRAAARAYHEAAKRLHKEFARI